MFAAFEHFSEEPYTYMKTILNDAGKYMFHNFIQCKWDKVIVDLASYCSTHKMDCGFLYIVNRIANKRD